MNSRIYSAVVDCGVNATSKFLPAQEQNPESCQWDDVNMALQEQADVVRDALMIEPGQCTGKYVRLYIMDPNLF